MDLITGRELKSLLLEHLGLDALIGFAQTPSRLGTPRRQLTPTIDTNRFGHHDPLSDVRVLSAQVSDYIGQLCGIF
jgi:hypothetical protein